MEQQMCLQLADDGHDNECEEDKHEQNNDDDDDDGDEGQWEGVADVRATSGATWLTLPRSVGGLDVGLRL